MVVIARTIVGLAAFPHFSQHAGERVGPLGPGETAGFVQPHRQGEGLGLPVVPWQTLCGLREPFYPNPGKWPSADRRRADAAQLFLAAMITRGIESLRTLRWRKTGSNSRSHREGKSYGEPLQASIAVSDLNLQVAPPFVSPSPIGNAQKSLSQERDRWFESGSLQR
jgi:hypothetical protein